MPEPKSFNGVQDIKELENFLFDMEQYFITVRMENEEAKVTMATTHLVDDAKLWWRSKYNDIQDGLYCIDTWERLKGELRNQFFSENVEILARRKIRELKHTRNIREYVKQFSTLMLDIRDMSEKDKVFCFVEGLKLWARNKLYEQRVQDLTTALATTERLFDMSEESPQQKNSNPTSNNNNRNSRPNS